MRDGDAWFVTRYNEDRREAGIHLRERQGRSRVLLRTGEDGAKHQQGLAKFHAGEERETKLQLREYHHAGRFLLPRSRCRGGHDDGVRVALRTHEHRGTASRRRQPCAAVAHCPAKWRAGRHGVEQLSKAIRTRQGHIVTLQFQRCKTGLFISISPSSTNYEDYYTASRRQPTGVRRLYSSARTRLEKSVRDPATKRHASHQESSGKTSSADGHARGERRRVRSESTTGD